jgi:G3E family GTPase
MERQTRTNQVFSRSHHNWREIDGCCICCRSLIFLRELLNLECKDGPNKIFVSRSSAAHHRRDRAFRDVRPAPSSRQVRQQPDR